MQVPKIHKDYIRTGIDNEGGIIIEFEDCHTYIPPKEANAIAYIMIYKLGIKIKKPKEIKYKEE